MLWPVIKDAGQFEAYVCCENTCKYLFFAFIGHNFFMFVYYFCYHFAFFYMIYFQFIYFARINIILTEGICFLWKDMTDTLIYYVTNI